MIFLEKLLKSIRDTPISILSPTILKAAYCPIDLSSSNCALKNYTIQDPVQCQRYIDGILEKNNAKVAYGGYLEKRTLYTDKPSFLNDANPRNIHLGIDFWTIAGTEVIVPLKGIVHSFKNNKTKGDYGPTIILKHKIDDFVFFTLYGHLSIASLSKLKIGMVFEKGDVLATLGTPDINVNYAPHLHFQIIIDIEDKVGDYPGVCSESALLYYAKNCPNPNLLLQL